MRARTILSTALAGLVVAACEPNLPEAGTAAAGLYADRCGGCHRLHAPSVLKAATWEPIVARMNDYMRRGGRPLTESEHTTVLDYLKRNAG